jgi:hypothetical protein
MRRTNLWATVCGREDLREKDNLYGSYRLCGAHFEVHMFLNDLRIRLQPGVIPTKFSHLTLPEETTVAGRADLQLQTCNPGCFIF